MHYLFKYKIAVIFTLGHGKTVGGLKGTVWSLSSFLTVSSHFSCTTSLATNLCRKLRAVRPLVAHAVRNTGWYLARGPWHWCMGSRQPGFQNQKQACFYDRSTQNTSMNHRTLKICCPCRRTEECRDGSQMLIIKEKKKKKTLPFATKCTCVWLCG